MSGVMIAQATRVTAQTSNDVNNEIWDTLGDIVEFIKSKLNAIWSKIFGTEDQGFPLEGLNDRESKTYSKDIKPDKFNWEDYFAQPRDGEINPEVAKKYVREEMGLIEIKSSGISSF